MKTLSCRLWRLLSVFLCLPFAGAEVPKLPEAPAVPPPAPQRWERISYPAMTPWRKAMILPSITVENKGKEGMALDFEYYLPPMAWRKKYGEPKVETVEALLYRNKEKPVKLKGTFSSEPYSGSGPADREFVTDHVFTIPWGPNAFDDAWVLLSLKERNFWVELPYGFTRDPEAPFGPVDKKRGEPVFPGKNKRKGPNDLIIPWESVSYPLEPFGGNRYGTLRLSNPFDTISELRLGGFAGNVREPQCGVKFIYEPGAENNGDCFSLQLERDQWRSQRFLYGRWPEDDRRWCTVQISVGEDKRTLTLPSSLLHCGHGHAHVPSDIPRLEIAEKWNPHF